MEIGNRCLVTVYHNAHYIEIIMRGFRNGFEFVRLSARLAFYAIITTDSLHSGGCDKLFKADGCVTAAVVRACDGCHTMCVAVAVRFVRRPPHDQRKHMENETIR